MTFVPSAALSEWRKEDLEEWIPSRSHTLVESWGEKGRNVEANGALILIRLNDTPLYFVLRLRILNSDNKSNNHGPIDNLGTCRLCFFAAGLSDDQIRRKRRK